MIYVLYGPDTYRSRKQLKARIEEYRATHGDVVSYDEWDAETGDTVTLQNVLAPASLFSSARILVIRHALSSGAHFDVFREHGASLRDAKDMLLILWDREIGKEGEKRLLEIQDSVKKTERFDALAGAALTRFIEEEAGERGVRLVPREIPAFVALADSWTIVNALEKRAVLGKDFLPALDTADERAIFALGDAFVVSPKEGLVRLLRHFHEGNDEFQTFSYLANYVRTLAIVKSALATGVSAGLKGLHPFVVKKASTLVRTIPPGHLRGLFYRFFEADYQSKTGLAKPKESLVAILLRQNRSNRMSF